MSHDAPADQSQRSPRDEAAPRQLNGNFRSTPNMIPFDTRGARAFDGSPFRAGMPSFLPPAPNLFTHPLINYVPQFSGFGSSYLAQFPGSLPSTMASTKVHANDSNNDKSQPRVEFKSPKEYSPHPPGQPLWPNYAPGYAPQLGPKHSRLPSNDVARKAPRKSTASSPHQNGSPGSSHGTSKPTQRHTAKQDKRQRDDSPLQIEKKQVAKSGRSRAKKPTGSNNRSTSVVELTSLKDLTPLKTQKYTLPPSVRSRPVILDDEDDGEEDDDDLPLRVLFGKEHACTPVRGSRTTPKTNTCNQFHAGKARSRPQPRYAYLVPEGLKGVQQALGEDNWTDYLILVEKKMLEEITKVDFVVQSKAIFMVFDDKTRMRIERQITSNVVLPLTEKHKQHGHEN